MTAGFLAYIPAQMSDIPPPFLGPEGFEWTRALNAWRPGPRGWRGWVFLMGWTPGGLDRAVGTGGFFGPPDEAGVVEIGYAMAASFREQGLATEAVSGLLDWAFSHPEVKRVVAHTEPHLTASRRVLEKTGFTEEGEAERDGAIQVRYTRGRP